MKRCPTSLIIREMHIKTTARHHLTSVRIANMKSLQINAGEGVEKRETSYTVGGNVKLLWRTVWKSLKKNEELPYDPAVPLLCVCLVKTLIKKDAYTTKRYKFIAAAAAAKLLQSCPTLCDPIDGSPPGSPVPGILQARTLEWVAISFSNA